MPKRVRWHLRQKPEVISGLLGVFLWAVETTIRQYSPVVYYPTLDAPAHAGGWSVDAAVIETAGPADAIR